MFLTCTSGTELDIFLWLLRSLLTCLICLEFCHLLKLSSFWNTESKCGSFGVDLLSSEFLNFDAGLKNIAEYMTLVARFRITERFWKRRVIQQWRIATFNFQGSRRNKWLNTALKLHASIAFRYFSIVNNSISSPFLCIVIRPLPMNAGLPLKLSFGTSS